LEFISPKRLSRIAIAIKPATLLKFHKVLVKCKYQLLFSKKTKKKAGPREPSQEVINAIIEMKRRNLGYGCRRIAMQISNAFGVEVSKDVVRRVLNKHFTGSPSSNGPSWLTFIGHMKDSLWSMDFFRAESIHLKSHWIMVVMDQFTRRIIGFCVHRGDLSGVVICRMFNKVIFDNGLPKYLSMDNDGLYTFYRWQANLNVLELDEIKSVPEVPVSHPFVERLIGSIRREFLDQIFFWNATDLERKLMSYRRYFNESRGHHGIGSITPLQKSNDKPFRVIPLDEYRRKKHCNGLYQLPTAA
jgi:transposase InsO family protein